MQSMKVLAHKKSVIVLDKVCFFRLFIFSIYEMEWNLYRLDNIEEMDCCFVAIVASGFQKNKLDLRFQNKKKEFVTVFWSWLSNMVANCATEPWIV